MNTFVQKPIQRLVPTKGFTMIELLIVVIMIGLLSIVGMGAYTASLRTGRDARRKSDLEQLRSALELYMSDNSTYPAALTDLVAPKKYITLPLDPSNDMSYYYNATCSGTPAVCTTYQLGTALENASGSCAVVPGLSCKDPQGSAINCEYCLDPYGQI